MNRLSIISKLLLVPVGLLTVAFSWLGIIGLGFSGTHVSSLREMIWAYGPLAAFPIFLLNFLSLRLSTTLLCLYVPGILYLYSWPRWPWSTWMLGPSEWCLIAAAVLQLGSFVSSRQTEKRL